LLGLTAGTTDQSFRNAEVLALLLNLLTLEVHRRLTTPTATPNTKHQTHNVVPGHHDTFLNWPADLKWLDETSFVWMCLLDATQVFRA
jgi:hypothetical protein